VRLLAILAFAAACSGGESEHKQQQQPLANQASGTEPRKSEEELKLELAQKEAAQAEADARDAMEKVEKVAKDLDELEKKLDKAVEDVVAAQNDADRSAAKSKLTELRKEQSDMRARVEAAKAAAEKADHKKGVHISKECLDNPLAKGCN
jgi:chromosome segregation ATPase